jgi:hypothetical protein
MGPFLARPPGRFERDVAALLIEVFRPRLDLLACRVDDEGTAEFVREQLEQDDDVISYD